MIAFAPGAQFVIVLGGLTAAVSFIIGAIPFGVIVSRVFYRRDIRAAGSGNIGAANALRTLGKRGAIAVLILDACKGAIPVLAARAFLDDPTPALELIAAFAAVAGHCFSPFLRFRGGKGVATHLGALIALSWPAAAAFGIVWIAMLIATGIASAASMVACVTTIAALWYMLGDGAASYGIISAALIIFKHRANIARLRAGSEPALPLFRKRTARS